MFLRQHHAGKDGTRSSKMRRVKKDCDPPSTSIPPLFDPDPLINRVNWARRFFPEDIPPDRAIRIWLGNKAKERGEDSTENSRHAIAEQVQSSFRSSPNGNHSDDRLTSTLQDIAEMVTAALCGEQERRQSSNSAVRHPIHGRVDLAQAPVIDAQGIRIPVKVTSVDSVEPSPEVQAELGIVDKEPYPTPVLPQSTSARNSADGKQPQNHVRSPRDIWEDRPADVPDTVAERSDSTRFQGSYDVQSDESDGSTTMQQSEPQRLQLHSTKHASKRSAPTSKGSTLRIATIATVCGAVLYAAIAPGGTLYRRTRIAPSVTPSQSVPPVAPAQDARSEPLQTSSNPAPHPLNVSEADSPDRNFLETAHPDTAHPTRVQNLNVVRSRDQVAVEVTTKGHVVPKVSKLTHPDRVVLDLADTDIATDKQQISVNTAGVKAVRMGMTGLNPPTTRIVVELVTPHEYTFLTSDNKLTLQLRSVPR